MVVSLTEGEDLYGQFNGTLGYEPNFSPGNITCGKITNADYNGTFPDDRLIPMLHPEEMLNPERQNPLFLVIVITHSITFLFGVVGNVGSVSVMVGDRKSRNATNLFLVSLAAADLLLLVICVPLETFKYFVIQWDVNGAVCKMAKYVELLSALASVLNLCAVSLERFIVIVFPMRSRSYCTISNCRKAIAIVWIIAIILSLPVIFVTDVYMAIYCNGDIFVTAYYCSEEGMPIMIYQLCVLFIAPGLLMVICYVYVIRELWKSTQNISYLTQAKSIRSTARIRESTSSSNGVRGHGNVGALSRCCREQQPVKIMQGNGNHLSVQASQRPRPVQPVRVNKGEDPKKTRKQVIKMLILVILLFLICWGPKLVLNLALKSERVQQVIGYTQWTYACRVVFSLIPFVHSCINPVIYSFMSKNFRRSMQRQFTRCCSFFGCKCLRCNGTNRNLIPLRSTARTQNVDLLYSSNYCPLADGVTNAHTEIESVSVM